MEVTYYRARRAGPEAAIESAVATRLPELFPTHEQPVWAAGSLPVGAGMPDLLFLCYDPHIHALADADFSTAEILAYLRAVGRARLETISERTRQTKTRVVRLVECLQAARAVRFDGAVASVTPRWRQIMPEIITVEAKVADWRRAAAQAARNHIFAHRSFIALPMTTAMRVRREPLIGQLRLGVLGVVENGEVRVVRRAARREPRVWRYYYQIALRVARHGVWKDALHSAAG